MEKRKMKMTIAALVLLAAAGNAVAAPGSALEINSGEAAGANASEFAVGSAAIAGVTVATAITGLALMAAITVQIPAPRQPPPRQHSKLRFA